MSLNKAVGVTELGFLLTPHDMKVVSVMYPLPIYDTIFSSNFYGLAAHQSACSFLGLLKRLELYARNMVRMYTSFVIYLLVHDDETILSTNLQQLLILRWTITLSPTSFQYCVIYFSWKDYRRCVCVCV